MYVRARCGESNHHGEETKVRAALSPRSLQHLPCCCIDVSITLPVVCVLQPHIKGGANPMWSAEHEHSLLLSRHKRDHRRVLIQLMIRGKEKHGRADTYISGGSIQLNKYIDNPNKDFTETIPLDHSGRVVEGKPTAGTFTCTIKYVPGTNEDRHVVLTALSASGLHVTHHAPIRDVGTHLAKAGGAKRTSAFFLLYVLVGTLFFRGYMADSFQGRGLDPTVLLELEGDDGDWDGINTMLFIVTTFTTIGYGVLPLVAHIRRMYFVRTHICANALILAQNTRAQAITHP